MTAPISPARHATLQALDAALGTCGAVFPAKGEGRPEPLPAAFCPSDRLCDALAFALKIHGDQARKGTTVPYVTHLLAVAALVGESGGSEDEMVAAILHDTVEDGGGAKAQEEIRRRFGAAVAEIVDGCTDDESGGEKATPWLDRKRAYLEKLANAPLSVLRVACADKLHNALAVAQDLRDQGPSVFQRFRGDREGTLWYYRSLARILGALVLDEPQLDQGFRTMIRELRETVASLEA